MIRETKENGFNIIIVAILCLQIPNLTNGLSKQTMRLKVGCWQGKTSSRYWLVVVGTHVNKVFHCRTWGWCEPTEGTFQVNFVRSLCKLAFQILSPEFWVPTRGAAWCVWLIADWLDWFQLSTMKTTDGDDSYTVPLRKFHFQSSNFFKDFSLSSLHEPFHLSWC